MGSLCSSLSPGPDSSGTHGSLSVQLPGCSSGVFLQSPATNVLLCEAQEPGSTRMFSRLVSNSQTDRVKGCVWALCSVSIPSEPGAELDVTEGERDALGSAGLSMTLTSQPCSKAGLQGEECWPRLYPNFAVFCTTPASQLHARSCAGSLLRPGSAAAGRPAAVSPRARLRVVGSGELGYRCGRTGQSHHHPPPRDRCPATAPKQCLTSST